MTRKTKNGRSKKNPTSNRYTTYKQRTKSFNARSVALTKKLIELSNTTETSFVVSYIDEKSIPIFASDKESIRESMVEMLESESAVVMITNKDYKFLKEQGGDDFENKLKNNMKIPKYKKIFQKYYIGNTKPKSNDIFVDMFAMKGNASDNNELFWNKDTGRSPILDNRKEYNSKTIDDEDIEVLLAEVAQYSNMSIYNDDNDDNYHEEDFE